MAKVQQVPRMTASDCVAALRKRYKVAEYAFLEQVANGTGFRTSRWADAVAYSLWPSRGLRMHGFEVKVSRGDWQRELKDPAKSAEIQAYCDHWWIVAPKGMIAADELPPTWGLLDVDAKLQAKAVVKAPVLEAEPMSRSMLAALLRRAAESQDALIKRAENRGRQEGAEKGAGIIARQLENEGVRVKELEERIERFRKLSGVDLNRAWNLGNVAKAVRVLSSAAHHSELRETLEHEARVYERRLQSLRKELDALAECPPAQKAVEE